MPTAPTARADAAVPALRLRHRQRRRARARPPAPRCRARSTTCMPPAGSGCGWSTSTRSRVRRPRRGHETPCGISDFQDEDAILAVATGDRAYAFLVPEAATGGVDVDTLRRNDVEPALRRGDWAGAAVAAANGLTETSSSAGFTWVGLVAMLAVIAIAVLGAAVVAAPPAAQAPRGRVRRRATRRSRRPQRAGVVAHRRARRPVPVDRRRRGQRGAHQRQRIGPGGRGIRRAGHRAVHRCRGQRQDDAGAGVQRPPDPRRRRAGDAAAAARPADPRDRRGGEGRPRTRRAARGVPAAARSGHQRPDPARHVDPADGGSDRPPRSRAADA